ncbi:uncharacterized protein I206_104398 [Kwoniella pini CBS 10737]|uniref:Fork-head domain-containing protein n=1 Tax=Kwoniella pini CBS 10737 TaxID=1296096 RepID=A0A1B9I1T9_9TREE|nr:uncharacterized protein I206_04020 [Kwoniella pini CBS 10737]OCF49499.1 hypothetical protein I206_04020 [Kwoniella pini CBS 10737]
MPAHSHLLDTVNNKSNKTDASYEQEGEKELDPDEDDNEPLSKEMTEGPPKKKSKRLKGKEKLSDLKKSDPIEFDRTSPIKQGHISQAGINNESTPVRPKIKTKNLFWRNPPPSSYSSFQGQPNKTSTEELVNHTTFPFTDSELGLRPLTWPSSGNLVVKTLGIPASLPSFIPTNPNDPISEDQIEEPFEYTRSDLIKYRLGKGTKSEDTRNRNTNIASGAWKKWEELGGISRGLSELIPYSFDEFGKVYKPDITIVQAIRLIIAASPRGRMTLAQIYQAFEERWPWHKTTGTTWKNSIRHNLSLNDCFVNIEKSTNEPGGKGGYWVVDNSASGRTARKLKRSAPLTSTSTLSSNSLPIKSKFGQISNSMSNSIIDKLNENIISPKNSTLIKSNKPIAKPAIPFPSNEKYKLPKRDKNWIPNEIIKKSREISLLRPIQDIPLDINNNDIDINKIQEEEIFTTRAGLNNLPIINPINKLISNENEKKLPNLFESIYNNLNLNLNNDKSTFNNFELPPLLNENFEQEIE